MNNRKVVFGGGRDHVGRLAAYLWAMTDPSQQFMIAVDNGCELLAECLSTFCLTDLSRLYLALSRVSCCSKVYSTHIWFSVLAQDPSQFEFSHLLYFKKSGSVFVSLALQLCGDCLVAFHLTGLSWLSLYDWSKIFWQPMEIIRMLKCLLFVINILFSSVWASVQNSQSEI